MAEGKRPGGLTALAVLNFVFGGLGTLGVLGMFAVIAAVKSAASGLGADVSSGPGVGILYVGLLLLALSCALLLASGVGYIKQKKFLGRTLGNVYAIVSLAGTVINLALAHQGFGVGTIINLVYPALTLFLVNNTFKDDLVN